MGTSHSKPMSTRGKRLLFACLVYGVGGSCVDGCLLTASQYAPQYGLACRKPYVWACHQPDFSGSWIHRVINFATGASVPIFRTNDLGHQGPDLLTRKEPGVVRIAFLGGSTSFQPLLRAYPDVLRSRLEGDCRRLGIDCEIVNAAMISYSVVDAEQLVRHEMVPNDVDIVVISEQWNYHYSRSSAVEKSALLATTVGQLPLLSALELGRTVYRFRRDERDGLHRSFSDEDLQAYLAALRRAATALGEVGGIPVLGIHPDNWHGCEVDVGRAACRARVERAESADKPSRAIDIIEGVRFKRRVDQGIRSLSAELAVPLIDWERRLRATTDPETLFDPDGVHVNEAGAIRMAEVAQPVIASLIAQSL